MNLVFMPVDTGFIFREDYTDSIPKMWAFSTIDEAVEWLRVRYAMPPVDADQGAE